MANRQVVVDLIVNTTRWSAGFRHAAQDMSSATTNMETKTKAMTAQFTLMGLAAVGAAATAVKKWADFDQAMSRVRATGGEAAKRIHDLSEAAKSDEVIELGYNMNEASDAIYELVKAGVSATDILKGGMSGALALAAAETMDAADAASIMASALTQFNLDGSQSAHVADLITAGAGKAQGSAHDLGLALKQSGLVANQFGLSIEQTTGSLAFFASAGLIGSDAGTSLRTMLLHLAGPSTKAANLMDEIGLEIYGANGQMVDMETLANNLQSSLGQLTEEQRNQALATIFGSDATRAASLLYREGGDAVAEWTEKVNDAGYAQDVARERMNNLNGDLKKLSASWDRMLAGMGEGADSPLRNLTQGLTNVINTINDMPPAVKGAMTYLTGGAGLLVLGAVGFKTLTGQGLAFIDGLKQIGIISEATAGKLTTGLGRAVKALGLLGIAAGVAYGAFKIWNDLANTTKLNVDALADSYDVAAGKFTDTARQLAAAKITEDFGWMKKMETGYGSLAEAARALKIPLDDLALAMIGNEDAAARVSAITDKLAISDLDSVGQKGREAQEVIDELGLSWGRGHDAAVLLNEAMGKNGEATDEAIQKAQDQAEAMGETEDTAGSLTGATDELTEATLAITAAEQEAAKAAQEHHDALVDVFTAYTSAGDPFQGVIDDMKAWAQAQADSTDSAKDSWEDYYDGVTVTADQYIAKLREQVEAQEAWASNVVELTARAANDMPPELRTAAQEMVDELRLLGPEGAAQIALLKSMSDTELQQVVELYQRQGRATGEGWASEVESAETPKVDVDSAEADRKLENLYRELAGLPPLKTVDVVINFSRNGSLQQALGQVPAGTGTVLRNAEGGAIRGPGTGKSDSILSWVSNGEHVWTADDVQKAGGQEAVYALRGAVQAGLLKFANGGGVYTFGKPSTAGKTSEYWQKAFMPYLDRLKLLKSIQDQEAKLRATGEDALVGIERRIAELDLAEDKQKLREAEYAANQGNQAYWDKKVKAEKDAAKKKEDAAEKAKKAKEDAAAKEAKRKEAVAGYKADVTTDISRGEIMDSLTSGMSGVYSVTDQARGYLENLTGSAKSGLAAAITAAEKAAKGLYSQLDSVEAKLEAATEKAEELRRIKDNVASGIVGGFSLGTMSQTSYVDPFTGKVTGTSGTTGQTMLAAAQAYAQKAKTFAGKLQALQKKGFSGRILQEIASKGVDGGTLAADALLSLSAADTKAMNTAYADIEKWAGEAGEAVTGGFYEGGLKAAEGVVAGLEANKDKIEAAINQMALNMQNALKKALGIKSPSRKFRAVMKFVGQGVALGLDDQKGIVSDAAARLFDNVNVPGSAIGVGVGGSGVTITPTLEGVTKENLDYLAEKIVKGFESGTTRHLDRYTTRQNLNRLQTYGTR